MQWLVDFLFYDIKYFLEKYHVEAQNLQKIKSREILV